MSNHLRLVDGCGYGVPPTVKGIVDALKGDTSYVSTPQEQVVATLDENNNEVDISFLGEHFQVFYLDSDTIEAAAQEFLKLAREYA